MSDIIDPRSFGAKGNGRTDDTEALQKAIDAAAAARGTLRIEEGTYVTGSLFLGSHMTLELARGAVLLGSSNEARYVVIDTRVAGIEMPWPAAIINAIGVSNVRICGEGMIDGNGPVWWTRYWGVDRHGGMRADYVARNMRWCLDYDCRRIRTMLIQNCENVEISGIDCIRSGFWTIQMTYCNNVHVDSVKVHENEGTSTDGIVVDSCSGVVIERCFIDCNDDDIAIKSGRDWDGLRVGRISENVQIQNCEIRRGFGITLGSETSGGIRNINIRDITFKGTQNAFRVKSSHTRGGVVERVQVSNLRALNVGTLFNFDLNWYPSYNKAVLPEEYKGKPIPAHWEKLLTFVPVEVGIPVVKNIFVHDIRADFTSNYEGSSQIFYINAYPGRPIKDVVFKNMEIRAREYGVISDVRGWTFDNLKLELCSE
ncbi:glycoside hydrolase family 28 protein [Butyrivibrio sp. MC2013]|uniref:glycoside hydrolase family 28 protein n=1 Tax=Butyrivibrio sp. MC2013 TaxID=1280686 RepID=UPI0003FEE30E|nr:glycosyl hydrolase family 28 protein [Butyrivibrio sp. MC2013]